MTRRLTTCLASLACSLLVFVAVASRRAEGVEAQPPAPGQPGLVDRVAKIEQDLKLASDQLRASQQRIEGLEKELYAKDKVLLKLRDLVEVEHFYFGDPNAKDRRNRLYVEFMGVHDLHFNGGTHKGLPPKVP